LWVYSIPKYAKNFLYHWLPYLWHQKTCLHFYKDSNLMHATITLNYLATSDMHLKLFLNSV